ncbi:DUF3467 domain-containing protein [Candidatus Parcubacteria bacterium]|nr:DUF3467 domain-containing protein [Candidatus Parcubacteria bacterium]
MSTNHLDCESTGRSEVEPGALYVTTSTITTTEEEFKFTVTSYNNGHAYAMSPKHAKRMYLLLKTRVEDYEKKYGELKTNLPQIKAVAEQRNLGFIKINSGLSKTK